MNVYVDNRELVDKMRSKGIEPLFSKWIDIEPYLRRELTKEMFPKNTQANNEKFYHRVLGRRSHICENCGCPIPHPTAINVSHILSRGAFPEWAYDRRNVNILCAKCHSTYENGDREGMKIYPRVKRTINKLKEEWKILNSTTL